MTLKCAKSAGDYGVGEKSPCGTSTEHTDAFETERPSTSGMDYEGDTDVDTDEDSCD